VERAAWLKKSADSRLTESLIYLLSVLNRGGCSSPGFASVLDTVKTEVDDGKRLGASAYALHSELLDLLRQQDGYKALQLIDTITPRHLIVESAVISQQGQARNSQPIQALFDKVMDRQHVSEYEIEYDARVPSRVDMRSAGSVIKKVTNALAKYDSPSAREIDYLVSDYLVINSDEINAGTSFKAHGLILLRALGKERSWTTYLENIVHETAHLNLFFIWTHDPVFESDPTIKRASPLRKKDRPLSGIFHAAYVLARTVRAIKIFRDIPEFESDIDAMSTSYNYLKNPDSFEKKFDDACAQLEDSSFTPVGKGLLDSCAAMVHG